MKSKIKIILEDIIPKGKKINEKTDLIKKGYLDSFSALTLIMSIEQKFKMKISLNKLDISNLGSIEKIEKFLKKNK
jgi:acyl carrier protein